MKAFRLQFLVFNPTTNEYETGCVTHTYDERQVKYSDAFREAAKEAEQQGGDLHKGYKCSPIKAVENFSLPLC